MARSWVKLLLCINTQLMNDHEFSKEQIKQIMAYIDSTKELKDI